MQTEERDKMVETIREVCEENEKGKDYFNTLKKIYSHISKHENEPDGQRAQSIKDIIDLDIRRYINEIYKN